MLGVRWIDQREPFQRSARVAPSYCVPEPPTATQTRVEAHETALGVLYDAQPDLDEYEAMVMLSAMLGVEPDCRELQRI